MFSSKRFELQNHASELVSNAATDVLIVGDVRAPHPELAWATHPNNQKQSGLEPVSAFFNKIQDLVGVPLEAQPLLWIPTFGQENYFLGISFPARVRAHE